MDVRGQFTGEWLIFNISILIKLGAFPLHRMHLDTSSIIWMDQQRPKSIWNAPNFTEQLTLNYYEITWQYAEKLTGMR